MCIHMSARHRRRHKFVIIPFIFSSYFFAIFGMKSVQLCAPSYTNGGVVVKLINLHINYQARFLGSVSGLQLQLCFEKGNNKS